MNLVVLEVLLVVSSEIESFSDRVRKGGPGRADLEALGGLPNGF